VKRLLAALALVVLSVPAQALAGNVVRVDRPEKGAVARVTHVRLLHGTLARRTLATVLTDTRCTPDRQGVSHCLNRMRLANGTAVTVVHDHRMMDMPCLSPGEHVLLRPSR